MHARIQTPPKNTHLSTNTLFVWNFFSSSFLLLFHFTMGLLMPLFIIRQTFRLAFLFKPLYAFTLRIYGSLCAFGWCCVDSVRFCIYQVKVWPTHDNLFAPNEFIVCIISQTLRYKTAFKAWELCFCFLHGIFFLLLAMLHLYSISYSFIHQLLNGRNAIVMNEKWWELRTKRTNEEKRMKRTHHCRCPLNWTCTRTMSVTIKQLKALHFF